LQAHRTILATKQPDRSPVGLLHKRYCNAASGAQTLPDSRGESLRTLQRSFANSSICEACDPKLGSAAVDTLH
jgi:hypothetical protein